MRAQDKGRFLFLDKEGYERLVRDAVAKGDRDIHAAFAAYLFQIPREKVTKDKRSFAKKLAFVFTCTQNYGKRLT